MRLIKDIAKIFFELTLIWVAVCGGFFLFSQIPGSPFQRISGERVAEALIEKMETISCWHEEKRFSVKAFSEKALFFWKLRSIVDGQPVWKKFLFFFKNSLFLALLVTLLLIFFEVFTLFILAWGERIELIVNGFFYLLEMVALALPPFISGLICLSILVSFRGFFSFLSGNEWVSYLFGALIIAGGLYPGLNRLLRHKLSEEKKKPYVQVLKMFGVSSLQIYFNHLLPNLWKVLLVQLGLQITGVIGGMIIVEKVLALKGVGWMLLNAIERRDLPEIQIIFLFSFILFYLVSRFYINFGLSCRIDEAN